MQETVKQGTARRARQAGREEPGDELGALWQRTLADLREQIVPPNFARWIGRTRLLSCAAGEAIVGVPDRVCAEQLQRRFDPLVRRALGDACGVSVTVRYQVDADEAAQG